MQRVIEPEWLDALPTDDSGAVGSRRDLLRLNACMGNARIMCRALGAALGRGTLKRLIELGAGDGKFLLKVAAKLYSRWTPPKVTLVDQSPGVRPETYRALRALGWNAEPEKADVFAWLRAQPEDGGSIIIANLFLHHFAPSSLAILLELVARRSVVFIAVEPRRSRLALSFSRMAGLIGCNAVTRHDAPVSVRAGFAGRELCRSWPPGRGWELREGAAGLFSHLFIARRKEETSGIVAG